MLGRSLRRSLWWIAMVWANLKTILVLSLLYAVSLLLMLTRISSSIVNMRRLWSGHLRGFLVEDYL